MGTLRALWHRSQLRALLVVKTLTGVALVAASMVNDDAVKAALQGVLSPMWCGVIVLAATAVLYLAAPHGDGK